MTGKSPRKAPARRTADLVSALLDLLACPDCRGSLSGAEGSLACGGCGREFAVVNGIPQLLPAILETEDPPDPGWRAWAVALDRLLAWRRQTWTGDAAAQTCHQTVSTIQAEFASHCRLSEARGVALDVGCGDGAIAASTPAGCRYVGVDPLPLVMPGGPDMVRGVGERLPFRTEVFDLVLVLQTLDHCMSAPLLLVEILRVLKPGGMLCVEQYVTRPRWRERLDSWWCPRTAPGRPAPAGSSKVMLLDTPDVEALVRPCFREIKVGRSTQGSHVFVAAYGKRESSSGI